MQLIDVKKCNVMNSFNENLIIIDNEFKIKYINENAIKTIEVNSKVYNESINNVLKIYDLLTKERVEINYNKIIEKKLKRGLPQNSIIYTNKGFKYISASFTPIKEGLGVLIVFRDITKIMSREQVFREYTEAVNNTPIGIVITNDKFGIEHYNPMAKELGNYSEDIYGKNIFNYHMNDNNKINFQQMLDKLKLDKSVSERILIDKQNNDEIWFNIEIVKMEFLNQKKYIMLFNDISEKVKNEKKIIEEKMLLDKMFSEVNIGIILLDKNFEIKKINEYIEKHFNIVFEERKKIGEIVKSNEESINNLIEDILNVKSYKERERKEYILDINNNKFFTEIGIIKFFRNGKENYLLSIFDYTRKKLIEEKLNKSEISLNLLAENMLDAITQVNLNGEIIYASPSNYLLFGYKADELIGKEFDFFLYEKNTLNLKEKYNELIQNNDVVDEYFVIKKNGEGIWIEIKFSLVNENGNESIVLVSRDATIRINARKKLIKAKQLAEKNDKMKGEFLANTSHEIRTPLNGIIGMSSISLMDDLPDNVRENVKLIKSSAESLMNIINGILDFSKIEAGKMDMVENEMNLKEEVENVYKNFLYRTKDKNIDLILEYQLINDMYLGDVGRIKQILINIIGNAVKFTSKGSVKIVVSKVNENIESDDIRFEIIDTGIGISKKNRESIFESYSQGDGTYTRKFGGTGLGLSICKMLVEKMRGTINLKSKVGEGSNFKIVLPLKRVELIEEISEEIEKIVETESIKILLVEDDIINRKFLRRLLEKLGHTVDIAENGIVAINKVMEKEFDLILMDIQLPEMDGIEVTKVIKNELGITDIPIIAITAHAREEDEKIILEGGLDDYISKPISIMNLSMIINRNIKSKVDNTKSIIENAFTKTISNNEYKKFDIKKIELLIQNKNREYLEKELENLKQFFNNEDDKEFRNIIFKSIMSLRRKDYNSIKKNMGIIAKFFNE
ncbi:ATP-binding protein [Clostridiaceae bacterium HSG29]|nr:ATP-binding protein [Clostridiaceae bacterium HSG29]